MAKTYLRTGRISWSPLTASQQTMLANVAGVAIGGMFSATLDSPTEQFLVGNGVIAVPSSTVVASSGNTPGVVPVDNGDGTYSWGVPSSGGGSLNVHVDTTGQASSPSVTFPLTAPPITGTMTSLPLKVSAGQSIVVNGIYYQASPLSGVVQPTGIEIAVSNMDGTQQVVIGNNNDLAVLASGEGGRWSDFGSSWGRVGTDIVSNGTGGITTTAGGVFVVQGAVFITYTPPS